MEKRLPRRQMTSWSERFEMNPQSDRIGSEQNHRRRHRRPGWAAVFAALTAACGLTLGPACAANASHAIAMHGQPALPPGFAAFRYVNPEAPKGGQFAQGILGTFDSLNPFNGKGLPLPEPQVRGRVIESLMTRGYDEPFTLYGLLARSVDTDADRTYVTFELDPRATFADGTPVTAADVIFSWQ